VGDRGDLPTERAAAARHVESPLVWMVDTGLGLVGGGEQLMGHMDLR
jgi:hypothetical protein